MTTGWKGIQDALVNDGVNGLIVMGTCGENNSFDPEEKRTILKAAPAVVRRPPRGSHPPL